jgi:uncharacterized protein (TIGR00159 family)
LSETLSWIASNPLYQATLLDWFDILVLAALIYKGLTLMRGTRALQSLLGLVLLGLIYFISGLIGMTSLNWVLDNLMVYVVLAGVILFQEDIRLALARAGGTFLTRSSRVSLVNITESLVTASFSLAQKKVGALIVIERTASLNQFTDGAVDIDAHLSASLIQAIFHPASPLHDGAVVITGSRIRAASVFLPMSGAEEISRTLGTRHRAALGLSELTDALVIVVSEERGTVMVVEKGHMHPVVDNNDLRDLLQRHIGSDQELTVEESL